MASNNQAAAVNWADDSNSEFDHTVRTESKVDAQGFKTVTEVRMNGNTQVKVTRRIKVQSIKVKKNKAIEARRKWRKFGDCLGNGPGLESNVTYPALEDIQLEFKKPIAEEAEAAPVDPWTTITQPAAGLMQCRLCGAIGDHIFLKCPKRASMGASAVDQKVSGKAPPPETPSAPSNGAPAEKKYIPPSLRGRTESSAPASSGGDQKAEWPTVRVTNLSDDATEDDVHELFSRVGHVHRVYIGRDRETNRSKGFAFVAFRTLVDAQNAIKKLDGYGYASLILHVDMADNKGKK